MMHTRDLAIGLALALLTTTMAVAQPCYAENDGPGFNDAVSMGGPNLLLAIRFTVPPGLTVVGAEVFTGERTGTNTLAIWSDDPMANAPSTSLTSGSWSMTATNSWQGTDLTPPLPLASGVVHWLVWGPQNGAQAAVDLASPSAIVQSYRGSFNAGATWNGPFSSADRPWKFRLFCLPAPYQTNQSCASLDLDGIQSSGFSPAVTMVGTSGSATATLSGNAGMPWDLAFTVGSALLPNYLVTSGGQIVNVNLALAGFLNNGTFTVPFAPFATSISPPTGASIEAQMVIVDPTQTDGFCLSQGAQLQ